MFVKLFCLILILKLAQGRYGFLPKFYGQDSAIIVDTDKILQQRRNAPVNFANNIRMTSSYPLWRHYPRYHIIPPPPPGQIFAINTWAKAAKAKSDSITPTTPATSTTTTSTTTSPKITMTSSTAPLMHLTDEEYPAELLYIAQDKLGLKSIDEIPSISELSLLLGTENSEKTLKYIKLLTTNEQGIALLKAYIESADYTDNSSNKNYILESEQEEEDDDDDDDDGDGMDDIEPPVKFKDEDLVVITDEDAIDDYELNEEKQAENNSAKTILQLQNESEFVQKSEEVAKSKPSFMERIANYMHLNKLFHKNEENNENVKYNELNRMSENGKTIPKKAIQLEKIEENQTNSDKRKKGDVENLKGPILVRESIPYNYPVPIRFQTSTSITTSPAVSHSPEVHLNSPKIPIPHIQQLSRVTKIPSEDIVDFLATKPKLLQLATKISQFPISYDRNSPIEAQIIAAVHKAFEQDEDLKKLLSSSATLK